MAEAFVAESGRSKGRVCRQAGDRRAVRGTLGTGSQGELRSWRRASCYDLRQIKLPV